MSHSACIAEEELLSYFSNIPDFPERTAQVILRAYAHVLDGAASLDDLEACEKAVLGVKVEKYWLREFGLSRVAPLDTMIAGHAIDLKHTMGRNWMIPPEALNQWCLLFKVAWPMSFSVGLLKMDACNLRSSTNRDQKTQLTSAGKANINWVIKNQLFL